MSFFKSPILIILLLSASAFAGAPHASFNGFVKAVAKETNRSEETVRDEAVETLRREGKFSDDELERIGRKDDRALDEMRRDEMVRSLQRSDEFRTRIGLTALRNDAVAAGAGAAFDAMKVKTVELSRELQAQWATALFAQAPAVPKLYAKLQAEFTFTITAREVPPYGDTYTAQVTVNGKTVELADKALLNSMAGALLKQVSRTGPHVSIHGKMTAERIARELPPYGVDQFLSATIE